MWKICKGCYRHTQILPNSRFLSSQKNICSVLIIKRRDIANIQSTSLLHEVTLCLLYSETEKSRNPCLNIYWQLQLNAIDCFHTKISCRDYSNVETAQVTLLVDRQAPVVFQQSKCKCASLTSDEQYLTSRSELTCETEFMGDFFFQFSCAKKNLQYLVWLKAFVTQEACGTEILPVDLRG